MTLPSLNKVGMEMLIVIMVVIPIVIPISIPIMIAVLIKTQTTINLAIALMLMECLPTRFLP